MTADDYARKFDCHAKRTCRAKNAAAPVMLRFLS
jgi:hypothetical protein